MIPRSLPRRSALMLCLAMQACGTRAPGPAFSSTDIILAAKALNERAAQDCPWPANLARYEQTTLIARNRLTPMPSINVFDTLKYGCSVMTFTLDDAGNVTSANIGSESPAGFGAVAQKILHWNDYAVGASPLTVFMVRVAAETLPNGGALTSLSFKDSVINLEVPP
jgi:hypothetical protein